MAWHPIGAKPLSEPMLSYGWLDTWEQISEVWIKIEHFWYKILQLKMLFAEWQPFYLSLNVLK